MSEGGNVYKMFFETRFVAGGNDIAIVTSVIYVMNDSNKKQDACSGVHTGLRMRRYVLWVIDMGVGDKRARKF